MGPVWGLRSTTVLIRSVRPADTVHSLINVAFYPGPVNYSLNKSNREDSGKLHARENENDKQF